MTQGQDSSIQWGFMEFKGSEEWGSEGIFKKSPLVNFPSIIFYHISHTCLVPISIMEIEKITPPFRRDFSWEYLSCIGESISCSRRDREPDIRTRKSWHIPRWSDRIGRSFEIPQTLHRRDESILTCHHSTQSVIRMEYSGTDTIVSTDAITDSSRESVFREWEGEILCMDTRKSIDIHIIILDHIPISDEELIILNGNLPLGDNLEEWILECSSIDRRSSSLCLEDPKSICVSGYKVKSINPIWNQCRCTTDMHLDTTWHRHTRETWLGLWRDHYDSSSRLPWSQTLFRERVPAISCSSETAIDISSSSDGSGSFTHDACPSSDLLRSCRLCCTEIREISSHWIARSHDALDLDHTTYRSILCGTHRIRWCCWGHIQRGSEY